jgi:putative glutamine amidotransferase
MSTPPLIAVTLRSQQPNVNAGEDPALPSFDGLRKVGFSSISDVGGAPIGVAPVELSKEQLRAIFDVCNGLVLSGGEDIDPASYGRSSAALNAGGGSATARHLNPVRDKLELTMLSWAREVRMPVLVICRGMQLLNVGLGGDLIGDLPSESPSHIDHARPKRWRETVHDVKVPAGSPLHEMFGSAVFGVNSIHHQAIKNVGEDLTAIGHAPDGVVEVVIGSSKDWYVMGLQSHPEAMIDVNAGCRAVFAAFVKEAKRFAERKALRRIPQLRDE